MPDKRLHRGPHPEDALLFSRENWPRLRQASGDLSWLLSRGYAQPSAVTLVGDRYQLAKRQRIAVLRSSCSDSQRAERIGRNIVIEAISGHCLWLDGYNVLTSVEAALAGGVILHGRDECYRDMASVHGTFRRVMETLPALRLIGRTLDTLRISSAVWLFDSPVSNSGRLRSLVLDLARGEQWNWQVELVRNPDIVLAQASEVIATADSFILDHEVRWLNLARICIDRIAVATHVIDMRPSAA